METSLLLYWRGTGWYEDNKSWWENNYSTFCLDDYWLLQTMKMYILSSHENEEQTHTQQHNYFLNQSTDETKMKANTNAAFNI